ncbi:Uncharacterised protein [uncultured Flavonifractor sp.]|nr:Uncharacterised protein [uncultured Flavonifractor sp.]
MSEPSPVRGEARDMQPATTTRQRGAIKAFIGGFNNESQTVREAHVREVQSH